MRQKLKKMSENNIRVRFAPSPTGPLHIGGVRTALYNYLFAKKNHGTFLLRIEDTDQTRFVPGAQDYIMESLKWCGIMPTEGAGIGGEYGPYVQSERKAMYLPYAEQLVENGSAYYAFDTPEEIEKARKIAAENGNKAWQYDSHTRLSMTNSLTLSTEEVKKRLENNEPHVIRFKMPENEDVKFQDMIRDWVTVNTSVLDDKVLFKTDGMPTYHLANIIDDHTMKITHVIRGEEWISSAPMHILLYRAFGWEAPQFAHLPLLLKPEGNGKLSKRDGDRLGFPVFPLDWKTAEGETYKGYREQGYYPEAFINMLAFLGWNPGTTQEIFSLDELAEAFDLTHVSKSGAKFDIHKTIWYQQQYLRAKSNTELANELKQIIDVELSQEKLEKICELEKERATFIQDIVIEGSYLYKTPENYNFDIIHKKWKEDSMSLVLEWKAILENITDFSAENLEKEFHAFMEKKEMGVGKLLPIFRYLVSNAKSGPSTFDIAALLGKEECLKRIDLGIKSVQQ